MQTKATTYVYIIKVPVMEEWEYKNRKGKYKGIIHQVSCKCGLREMQSVLCQGKSAPITSRRVRQLITGSWFPRRRLIGTGNFVACFQSCAQLLHLHTWISNRGKLLVGYWTNLGNSGQTRKFIVKQNSTSIFIAVFEVVTENVSIPLIGKEETSSSGDSWRAIRRRRYNGAERRTGVLPINQVTIAIASLKIACNCILYRTTSY